MPVKCSGGDAQCSVRLNGPNCAGAGCIAWMACSVSTFVLLTAGEK